MLLYVGQVEGNEVSSYISYNSDLFASAHGETGDAALVASQDAEGEVVRYDTSAQHARLCGYYMHTVPLSVIAGFKAYAVCAAGDSSSVTRT